MEIIDKYLYIEKIRFEEYLDYDIHVDEAAGEKEILCFLIQPLVENAVKHGIKSSKPNKLKIRLHTFIEDPWLNIHIDNTGKWGASRFGNGTGLQNIKDRLENAYPSRHRFKISEENDWIKVTIQIKL